MNKRKRNFLFFSFSELINGSMILEREKKKKRGTNCLCHSNKTAHSQTNRKEEKKTKQSADDPIIVN
jgi:hypothetical protein